MRDRTALQLWIATALLAAASLALGSLQWGTNKGSLWMVRLLAGSVTLAGVLRILGLARLMYRAGKVRLAGMWILFACITAAIVALWWLSTPGVTGNSVPARLH